MIIYKQDELIYIEDAAKNISGRWIPWAYFTYRKKSSTQIKIVAWEFHGNDYKNFINTTYLAADITDRFGEQYGTTPEQVIFGFNKGTNTNEKDRTSDAVIQKFNKVTNSTTLSEAIPFDGDNHIYDIIVTDATGASIGSHIILFNPDSQRFSTFTAITVVSTTITVDTPIDFAYPAGTFVDIAITNMAVDGSVTPQIFGLRGTGAPPGVDIDFHMTRIMISCLTVAAVDLSKFADIVGGLLNGLVFRSRNSRFHNIFNVKTNREIDAIFGTDWKPYDAQNQIQGQHGFTARLTFTGLDKIGVTIDLPIGDDGEFIIQDPLQTITLLEAWGEGHITESMP